MIKIQYIHRIFLAVIFLTAALFNLPSQAQSTMVMKPLTTGFLFEFARKLFDRGEFDEAQVVLKRILRSDPENSSVKLLLQDIEDQKNINTDLTLNDTLPSDIASDIIFIQQNVVQFERRNRDLEFAIRKMLQENAFLYQTLSHRYQELLELRKKFFGYDGSVSYQANSSSMQKITEMFGTYEQQIAERDQAFLKRNEEIARIMNDVEHKGNLLTAGKEIGQNMDSAVNAVEWKNDLTEKRSYLVEKALTLFEKNKDLAVLFDELTAVSNSLKEADDNFGGIVEEYEVKIQQLNDIWVNDKVRQQTEIDSLKAQIRKEKVKVFAARLTPVDDGTEEIDQAKISAEAIRKAAIDEKLKKQSNARKALLEEQRREILKPPSGITLTPERPHLQMGDGRRFGRDSTAGVFADPQREIQRLQGELTRKEKELNERSRFFDAKIRQFKNDWAQEKSIEQQSMIRRKYLVDTADEDVFKTSDIYSELMQQLDYWKDQVSLKEEEFRKFQGDMVEQASQLEDLQKRLGQRDSRLADMDALIVVKDQQILSLKKELVARAAIINQQNNAIEELKAKVDLSQTGIKDLDKRKVAVKSMGDGRGKPVDELKALVAELEGQIGPDAKLKDSVEDIREQLAGSLEALQQKDRELQDLKAQLEDEKKMSEPRGSDYETTADADVRNYEQTMDYLKNRLATAVSEHREAQKKWEQANNDLAALVEDMKKSKGSDGSSSGQLTELTQKISELNNQLDEQTAAFDLQLQTLRDKLAQKNAEISDLKDKLVQKEKQVEQFYESIEKATEKLNARSSSRYPKQTAVPAMASPTSIREQASDIDKNQKYWNPADNDVFALQQRLDTLDKELQYTQNMLTSRTKETSELKEKLKELWPGLSNQEHGEFAGKDIGKLEEELALIRQQSDLTKTTIKLQQSALAKSQREADQREKSLKLAVDQLEYLKKQAIDYKFTIQEKDEQIVSQQKALEHEVQKNETLKIKLKDITRAFGSEQEIEMEQAISTADLRNNSKSYEIRERDYKRRIDNIQEQLKTSYGMIEDGESRMTTLKQRLRAREERIAALEEELNRRKGLPAQTQDTKVSVQGK